MVDAAFRRGGNRPTQLGPGRSRPGPGRLRRTREIDEKDQIDRQKLTLHNTQAAPAARPAPLEAKSPAVLDGIGATAPFAGNGKCWDPVGFTERTEDSLMLWYRAAELKHGRVCMLAFTGWWVTGESRECRCLIATT